MHMIAHAISAYIRVSLYDILYLCNESTKPFAQFDPILADFERVDLTRINIITFGLKKHLCLYWVNTVAS